MVINTYKVTIECNCQAESEQAAKTAVIDLLQSPQATNPQTGAPSGQLGASVAGINKVECENIFEDKQQAEETTNIKKEEEKRANEQLKTIEKQEGKTFGKELEIPDEVAIQAPGGGTGMLVENPAKEQQEQEAQKQQEQSGQNTNKLAEEQKDQEEKAQGAEDKGASGKTESPSTSGRGRHSTKKEE